MQKIIIKNFGPVKDAEIEIKKVLVLIGEQASGKSTIAKLIYFFKGLPNYLLYHFRRYISNNLEKINTDIEQEIIDFIKDKFYKFWASSRSDNFNITYYYDFENNRYLEVSSRDDDIYVNFSHNFIDRELNLQLEIVRKSYLRYVEEERQNPDGDLFFIREDYYKDFLFFDQQLYRQFNKQYYDQLFMAASRSISINSFSLFEKESSVNLKSMKDLFSINELITMEFSEKVSDLQRIFRGLEGFKGIVKYNISTSGADDRKIGKAKMLANLYDDRIFLIFKGTYFIDNNGEAIITKDGKKVDLSESSSGQQEVIRILQDVFIIIHLNQKVLRVIEEPEAHLFPVAQKKLVELLALMVNYQPENQLIITTHSPYILSVFSNLLFASRVVEKNPAAEAEVQEIIDKDCWLNPQEFSAYSLGNHSFPEEMQYCESIFDNKMGNIKQNYLDTVSEILGAEFSQLYSIHGKTFKRR
jgi:predicted ATPase